jgi:hypothetical protein
MTFVRRAPLPLAVAAVLLAAGPAAAVGTPPAAPADATAVVNLTYDVTIAGYAEAGTDDVSGFVAEKFSRPTSAPLPITNPLAAVGLTIAPGSTIVISVFSTKRVNDSLCITGTSSKTATVVYLSSKNYRPTTKRPHGCALPGHPPIVAKPAKALIVSLPVQNMTSDLRDVSIGEQSYATDNDGSYVADTLSRPLTGGLSATDPLVQQGVTLHAGDTVVATLFTEALPNDSYCLTATSVKTKAVVYLSSVNDTATSHRPKGCVA